MFCDAAACRRFYDMYPNGLDVTVGGNTAVIFVDMDSNPDVMSSRIREALDQYDATRVLRVVGADMNINMTKLVTLAEEGPGNVKVEKIIDIYAPSTVRSIHFHHKHHISIYPLLTDIGWKTPRPHGNLPLRRYRSRPAIPNDPLPSRRVGAGEHPMGC